MKRIVLTAVALMAASPAAAVTTTTLGAVSAFSPEPTALYSQVNYINRFASDADRVRFDGTLRLSSQPGNIAAPAGDSTQYGYVSATNTPTTFSTVGIVFNQVSLYWGSMDSFNQLSFINAAGNIVAGSGPNNSSTFYTGTTFNGDANDDGQLARYVTFTFDAATAAQITGIRFASPGNNAFEFDNLILGTAVPEPSTWAMMMVGLGLVGGAMRRRSKSSVKALAAA